MATPFDPGAVLRALATRRRVFHSEADFQFAFAWAAKEQDDSIEVRLETHPEPQVRLDLQLDWPTMDQHVAIELKYMTRLWAGSVGDEDFALKNHGAQDIRSYDVVKDIERVERFVGRRSRWSGFVIAVSNDPSYWRPRTHGRASNADAFRLSHGSTLDGTRAWGPLTGAGTSRGREDPIALRGRYEMVWQPFSTIVTPATEFRSLTIPVDPTQ